MVVIEVIAVALLVVMLAAVGLASTDSRQSDPLAVAVALPASVHGCSRITAKSICQSMPVSAWPSAWKSACDGATILPSSPLSNKAAGIDAAQVKGEALMEQ